MDSKVLLRSPQRPLDGTFKQLWGRQTDCWAERRGQHGTSAALSLGSSPDTEASVCYGQEIPLRPMSDHITSLLLTAHWLPITHVTRSKILAGVHQAPRKFLMGAGPTQSIRERRGASLGRHSVTGTSAVFRGWPTRNARDGPAQPRNAHVPHGSPAPAGHSCRRKPNAILHVKRRPLLCLELC